MTAATADVPSPSRPRVTAPVAWLRERGTGASILVAAISTAFGVVLISATGFIAAMLQADPYIGNSGTLGFVQSFLTLILLGVAVYAAAIVTANTFSTIVAGRTRQIALLRLIGASAKSQRAEVARQGLVVGAIGAFAGLVGGTALAAAGVALATEQLRLDGVRYAVVQPTLLLPAAIVTLTTWAAAWAGSRRVLTVTPLEALGGSVESSHGDLVRHKGRNATAIALFVAGGALLALGILAGLFTPLGVVVAFFGGLLSFTGLALGATLVMPPVLQIVGRAFGRSATARLAAENALRYPERSSRMAIGVVMGVTLVTMLAVATESAKRVLAAGAGDIAAPIDTFAAIMMGLVAVSAVIAGVGLVNLLTLGVIQRRREFGLLRALGLSNGQLRRLVLLEAAHITVTALVTGLLLGVAYGWAGAQSLLGFVRVDPDAPLTSTLVAPAVPLWPTVAVVAATAVLTLIAAVVPTRLATRVTPVEALADSRSAGTSGGIWLSVQSGICRSSTLRSLVGVVLLVVSAVIGMESSAGAQSQPGVREVLEEYVHELRPPGVALVTLQGGSVRTEVFGQDGSGGRVNLDTRFRIASMSKAFTALAVLQQVDAGRLRLDDRLADVLPDLRMDDDRYRSVTIRHLLTHQSGLLEGDKLTDRPARSAAEVVERLAGNRLAFVPGTRTDYSSTGYSVLARVVEVVTGADFNDYLTREVFAPLGMTSTTSTSRCDTRVGGLPRGYTVVLAVRIAIQEPPGACEGNGGVISTARDMGVWLRFQLGDGTSLATGDRLLRASSLRAMHDVPAHGYAFGWEDPGFPDTKTIGHGGTLTTYNSYIEFSPGTGTGAVALTNAVGAPVLLTHNTITALDGGPHQDVTASWDLVDIINTVLLAVITVVLLIAGLILWRSRRWAERRRTSPGWTVALRLLPLALLAVLGALLPAFANFMFGGIGGITIAAVSRLVWGLPMVGVLGLVAFLGFGCALAGRLMRLRQARRTLVATEQDQRGDRDGQASRR